MPSLLQSTERALGGNTLTKCDSRSLRLTRYALPDLKDDARKAYLAAAIKAPRETKAAAATLAWQNDRSAAHQIHARLEARLLVNVSGSVLENAGLCLDRYGTAYVPGSAVKGAARRAAVATLRQWCETGMKPADDDLFASASAPFTQPAELLQAILRVFGCTDLEWEGYDADKAQGNDLAWACADQWSELREQVRTALNAETQTPDAKAPIRRGAVAFLAAYPAKAPAADLELDVLTPHHKKYYEGTRTIALDDEDPVPVIFPAVAAGAEYTFTLLPLGRVPAGALEHAATWLRTGLTTFGLGAKTNAGYGWFSDITATVIEYTAKQETARIAAAAAQAAVEKHRAELAAQQELKAQFAAMSPAERADAQLTAIVGDKGRLKSHLTKFRDLGADDKAAVLRWFAIPGSGRELWLNEIKTGQGKPKDARVWKQIIGDIHAAKKTLKIDLP